MTDNSWFTDLPQYYQGLGRKAGLDRIGMNRRNFMKGAGTAAAIGAGAGMLPKKAKAANSMGYMCWEGYNAPVMVEPFEAENDVSMNIDVIIDDPSSFGKLIAGGHRDVDVITLDAPWIQRMGPAGLCEYLDIADYQETYDGFYSQFAHPFEPLMYEGQITGLPNRWGNIGIMMNTAFEDPDDWPDFTAAFEPRNKDKIAMMDFGDYPILILAQHIGVNPYVPLDQGEINEVRMVLRKCFEQSRLLVGDLTLLQKGLVDGSIVTGFGCGNYCTSGARYAGHRTVRSLVPQPLENGFKRGAIWLEATAIVREPNNPQAAENWVKWCQTEFVCRVISLGEVTSDPTPNAAIEATYTEDERDILEMDQIWDWWDKSMFQIMLPNVDELLAIFQEELARST